MWECLCDCGTTTIKRQGALQSNSVISCGCAKNTLPPGESSFHFLLDHYKRNATKRGYSFELTKEQFRKLTRQPCHYCSLLPSQIMVSRTFREPYIYNGVDRKNNSIGYTIDNSVTCCGQCNKAKGTTNYEDFILWIKRLVKHHAS
jgi:hypothetical protein